MRVSNFSFSSAVMRNSVSCGIVAYSSKELKELFGSGKPELAVKDLRLLHEAKRAGGQATDHQYGDASPCQQGD